MATRQPTPPPADGMVSFKLSNFTSGAGLGEGIYLLVSHDWVLWDYEGKIANQVLAMKLTAQPVTIDAKGQVIPAGDQQVQHYSAGDPVFSITPDSKSLIPMGTRSSLGKSSNFYIYLENLVNSGFPEDQFDNNIGVFDGTVVRIVHMPEPTRNMPQSNLMPNASPRTGPRTISVPNDVLKLPWEQVARKPGAAPAKAAAPVAPAAAAPVQRAAPVQQAAPVAAGTGEGPEALLTTFLAPVLNGSTSIARTQARVDVFKSMNAGGVSTVERDAAMKLFNDENVLSSVLMGIGDGYVIDGATIRVIP